MITEKDITDSIERMKKVSFSADEYAQAWGNAARAFSKARANLKEAAQND